jgi:uncharacterized protein (DUF924 family)
VFWQQAGPKRWFKKNARFDSQFRERFAAEHEAAVANRLDHWRNGSAGCLALLILLDQYPRNAFRDTARMFASDPAALQIARQAVLAGFDRDVEPALRQFFYLPFMHSEQLADQDRALTLCQELGEASVKYARIHRDIIARFGRFPHRNPMLGRISTEPELQFLANGGFSG